MTPLERVGEELRAIGFVPKIVKAGEFVGNGAVVIEYPVTIEGRHKGRTFTIAIGFQEDAYPEYPPHFIYVAGFTDPQLPVYNRFCYDNADWFAFSVPPSDFWDRLPSSDKNMKTYVSRHLTRFWSQV